MTDTPSTTARDYRETVFLPQTAFPMRAGLPQKEPEILAGWSEVDLYKAIRAKRQAEGAPLFVLHDGPPYANGAIHIGHALNKLLKDFVVRSRFLLGYDVDYRPGWDCHGLPIEWKIEEEFRAKGRRKDEVPAAEFRARCREYAAQWIEVQKADFKRLGILGDWDNRYATMDYGSEATIVSEFMKFAATGQLYRGSKPVMWSPVERTALADAEVEYANHTSPTVWVKFPLKLRRAQTRADRPDARVWNSSTVGTDADPNLRGASVVIWTTTPWTLPANRAISFNPKIAYAVYEVEAMQAHLAFEPWAAPGDRLIVAEKLADDVFKAAMVAKFKKVESFDPSGVVCDHPLAKLDAGYGFEVPMLSGDHVTDDAGTGFVHTAPGHGADDYNVWLAHGLSREDIPDTVDPDGTYYPHVPLFAGLKVIETEGKKDKVGKFGPANKAVMDKLIEAGALLARGRLEHSYPHSWRSKAPVIFRNTPQWFIRMDEPLKALPPQWGKGWDGGVSTSGNDAIADGAVDLSQQSQSLSEGANTPIPGPSPIEGEGRTLRSLALKAIDETTFHPAHGKNRIGGMVETRPDWLISRQRAWGAPLAMFVDKNTGVPLVDAEVNERILSAIREGGADAWFTRPASDFLGAHDANQYEKIEDILDVWFDSGCTHAFTIEGRDDSHWPADLYLEGSDQHRGWFQSSLLESCGTRGRAPYKAVLTHGFTLDEQGEKMSKSKGNTIDPQTVIKESGAEILRLWVAMVDYADDQRIGKQILQTTIDGYRKLRNTLRYLLGALDGFSEAERVAAGAMPPLEQFILHRLWELDKAVRAAYEAYDFRTVWREVTEFCAGDLSTLYFDIRKDALYCDRPDSERRRACRTVMDEIFLRLTAWLSPLAAFTCEEAWASRFREAGSNALRVMPGTPAAWRNDAEAARWRDLDAVLSRVTAALEVERREKRIGSALEAAPVVPVNGEEQALFDGVDAAEIFRTSGARFVATDGEVEPALADGHKCDRCWRILPEVKPTTQLCFRCEEAVADWDSTHA